MTRLIRVSTILLLLILLLVASMGLAEAQGQDTPRINGKLFASLTNPYVGIGSMYECV